MKRPFLAASLLMLLAILPMRMMRQSVADAGFQPAPFSSPLLHAEFHTSADDVLALYGAGDNDVRQERTYAMRQAHRHDNFFLCIYGLFLAMFAVGGFRLTRKKYFLWLILLAVVAACADFLENYTIVQITYELDNKATNFSPYLGRLATYTWLKWLSLAAYFGMLVRFFNGVTEWGNIRSWAGKLLAWGCTLTAIMALLAFGLRTARWENWMAQAIIALFAGLFLFGLFFRKKTA
ncbi:MAG: hypothetical protein R3D58_11675 [Saprospiraceae bacterium]